MENRILDGENIKPRTKKQAETLIGFRVKYLRECDIDKSGRGYFFPKFGVVTGYFNRQLIIDGDYIPINSIVEMQLT